MTKIVHVIISEKYIEGYSYQENLLASKQKEFGFDVYIIASQLYFDANGEKIIRESRCYTNAEGVHVTILPATTRNHYLFWIMNKCCGLYKTLCEISPDIIFMHGLCAKDHEKVIKYKKRNLAVQLFADNHNDYYNAPIGGIVNKIKTKIISYWCRRLVKYVNKVWGTTPWRMEYQKDVYKIPADKTDLLIMGADESQIIYKDKKLVRKTIREQYHIPENVFLVVTGGKLDKRKQQNILMDAVKELEQSNVWLLVFGAPSKEMEPVFARYNNISNIKMAGWIDSKRAYDMFLASDLAFFPGTHSVLWEQAIACGLPSVFKFWSGMTHVNVNGNAILLDTINVDMISQTIKQVMEPSLYAEMKQKAEAVASQFYLKEIALKAIE